MRFLLCIVMFPESTPCIQLRAYPLRNAKSPDEVSYPTNTIGFTFAEEESVNALYEKFMVFKPTNGIEMAKFELAQQNNDSKLYLIGKRCTINGQSFICNEHLRTLMPIKENSKVIVVPE